MYVTVQLVCQVFCAFYVVLNLLAMLYSDSRKERVSVGDVAVSFVVSALTVLVLWGAGAFSLLH